MTDIELIELHDARISDLKLRPHGEVLTRFIHLSVYERLPERLAHSVVSYSGELVAHGTTSVRVSGVLDPTYKVMQVLKNGEEISSEDTLAMLHGRLAGGLVVFQFIEQCSIEVNCSSLSLTLTERIRTFEVWEGPLR